jgi:hypothetical protein
MRKDIGAEGPLTTAGRAVVAIKRADRREAP